MREIKFRAWDEWDKSFDYMSLNTLINGYGDDCVYTPDGENPLRADMVEQYTGLRDKNGREIYEGDILSDGAMVEFFKNLNWDSGGSIHPGFYCKKWMEYDQDGDMSYHYGFSEVEVIGNIHENPEPLK